VRFINEAREQDGGEMSRRTPGASNLGYWEELQALHRKNADSKILNPNIVPLEVGGKTGEQNGESRRGTPGKRFKVGGVL